MSSYHAIHASESSRIEEIGTLNDAIRTASVYFQSNLTRGAGFRVQGLHFHVLNLTFHFIALYIVPVKGLISMQ